MRDKVREVVGGVGGATVQVTDGVRGGRVQDVMECDGMGARSDVGSVMG